MSERAETCQNCRWWEPVSVDDDSADDQGEGHGLCRRMPPFAGPDVGEDGSGVFHWGYWPHTINDSWCGE